MDRRDTAATAHEVVEPRGRRRLLTTLTVMATLGASMLLSPSAARATETSAFDTGPTSGQGYYTGISQDSQTFVATASGPLTKVTVLMNKRQYDYSYDSDICATYAWQPVTVELHPAAADGSSIDFGTTLASTPIAPEDVSCTQNARGDGYPPVAATFATPATITAGSHYALTFTGSGGYQLAMGINSYGDGDYWSAGTRYNFPGFSYDLVVQGYVGQAAPPPATLSVSPTCLPAFDRTDDNPWSMQTVELTATGLPPTTSSNTYQVLIAGGGGFPDSYGEGAGVANGFYGAGQTRVATLGTILEGYGNQNAGQVTVPGTYTLKLQTYAGNGIYTTLATQTIDIGVGACAPPDDDHDGVANASDNCASVANADQVDADEDGIGDACDAFPHDPANDGDGDGVGADVDVCPSVPDATQADADGDGIGDECDAFPFDAANDADGDGRGADADNCPSVANATQADSDGDGAGDACDNVLAAVVGAPVNRDGSSTFKASRGVVPIKFSITNNGAGECPTLLARIGVTRVAGDSVSAVDEALYTMAADAGSAFRISSCQYVYNLNAMTLGVGTYEVTISINGGTVAGTATFSLS